MKFIIITLLVIFIFGKVFKYAFKYWVMSTLQKSQNQGFNPQNNQQTKKEGSIHINQTEKKESKLKGTKGGEYIDYEIVK